MGSVLQSPAAYVETLEYGGRACVSLDPGAFAHRLALPQRLLA